MDATYWSMDECCWVSWSPERPLSAAAAELDPVATAAIPAQLADAGRPVHSA